MIVTIKSIYMEVVTIDLNDCYFLQNENNHRMNYYIVNKYSEAKYSIPKEEYDYLISLFENENK